MRVAEEIEDSPETFERGNNIDHWTDQTVTSDGYDFVIDDSSQPMRPNLSHPPPEQIHQLLHIFASNVDPLTKVVHAPTLLPALQKAGNHISAISANFKALMFAIYSAACMSLKDDECKQKFGESRKALLKRYVWATKAALSQAKFMQTTSLIVLQALLVHLISVRDIEEPRAVWSLTGVAVRIAQSMGLDRDGEALGIPPFETELRRRIWWWLKTHDFRTAELCGLSKFRDLDTGRENPKWPANIGDHQLFPGMTFPLVDSKTLTDMVFVVVRYELTNVAAERISKFRQAGESSSHWTPGIGAGNESGIEEAVDKIQDCLETKYLRYCDLIHPLQMLTMLMARAALNHIRFMAHHPRRWSSIQGTSEAEKELVWSLCINMLEQHIMAQSNPMLQRFAWHAAYTMPWQAVIHVLDILRVQPPLAGADKAWRVIGDTYENNPDLLDDMRKPIHMAVGSLCLKAWNARENTSKSEQRSPPFVPCFISRLNEQREANISMTQSRDASNASIAHTTGRYHGASVDETLWRADLGTLYTGVPSEAVNSHQFPYSGSPPILNNNPASNSLHGLESFNDGQLDDMQQAMDLETMLAQMHASEDDFQIDWKQWDAFVAESNLMGPLS